MENTKKAARRPPFCNLIKRRVNRLPLKPVQPTISVPENQ